MTDVVAAIEAGFRDTPHPGARFLQGSFDGREPAEAVAPFAPITDWRQLEPAFLDQHYTALSFLSEGGFRFFLPAWLRADVRGQLETASPLFHLTMGFSRDAVDVEAGGQTFAREFGGQALLNPRRYGAMTFEDSARHRLSVFCREEAAAIVAYLEHQRTRDDGQLESVRRDIDAALDRFWTARAASAPTSAQLRAHVEAERAYARALGVPDPPSGN